jgi:isopentenyl diphosphate isomerase/L-lactate dehydrogenase-like FMN-dependent dehydrogenase
VCAAGRAGAERALRIVQQEAFDALGLLGANSLAELGPDLLMPLRGAPSLRRNSPTQGHSSD